MLASQMFKLVCVCVCVRGVREREKEREREFIPQKLVFR